MLPSRLIKIAVTAIVGVALLAPAAVQARPWHHYWRHHHHWHRWHDVAPAASNIYGSFPNVVYFRQNGHTYGKDKETGYTYLVR